MPAHARDITNWSANRRFWDLMWSWTPPMGPPTATHGRVLRELRWLLEDSVPDALPRWPRHSRGGIVVRRRTE